MICTGNHPNPAKPGELRWFTTIGGRDQEMLWLCRDAEDWVVPGTHGVEFHSYYRSGEDLA